MRDIEPVSQNISYTQNPLCFQYQGTILWDFIVGRNAFFFTGQDRTGWTFFYKVTGQDRTGWKCHRTGQDRIKILVLCRVLQATISIVSFIPHQVTSFHGPSTGVKCNTQLALYAGMKSPIEPAFHSLEDNKVSRQGWFFVELGRVVIIRLIATGVATLRFQNRLIRPVNALVHSISSQL